MRGSASIRRNSSRSSRQPRPSGWAKLVKAHGGDEDRARQRFTQRLAQQIDERGTVDVIRHGVRDQNVEIRLSYRKPAFGVAPELVAHYDANRLTVTRQLPFDPESNKTIDLCLFLNGIPVATAELKNHLTGQNIEQAIEQYRTAPRSQERHPWSARAGSLRSRPRCRRDDYQAGGEVDPVPSVQPGPQPRKGQPSEPQRPQDLIPVGARLGEGCLAGHPASLHPCRASRQGLSQRAPRRRSGDLPAFPPVGCGAQAGGRRSRQRCGPVLSRSSIPPGRGSPTPSHGRPTGSPPSTTPRITRCSTRSW